MIYVFGNSHAHTFSGSKVGLVNSWGDKSNKNFTSYSLGPVISYNFIESHYDRMMSVISGIKIEKNDHILLVIGEVDCRWHIPYQAAIQNRSESEVVEECVERFFRAHTNLKNSGFSVIGWGGHPSTTGGHNEDSQQPVYGDCLSRNRISRLWDRFMKEKCFKNQIPYVSIVEELIDEQGLSKMEYFDDYCHLNHDLTQELIESKFRKENLIYD